MGGLLAKPETAKHTEDGLGASGQWAFGVSEMQGWRPGMEDAHVALPDFDTARKLGLFAVFDGHGGAAVAKVAAARLPDTLRELPAFKEGNYKDALYEAFLKIDAFLDSADGRREVGLQIAENPPAMEDDDDEEEMLKRLVESGEVDPEEIEALKAAEQEDADSDFEGAEEEEEHKEEDEEEDDEADPNSAWASGEGPDGMGSTAVVALVCGGENPEVLCANAGDSRCVLARGDKSVALSRDHKPALKMERTRIHKAGGFVTEEGRVDGNLNLSRALGDFVYKTSTSLKATEQKISCEAEVRQRSLCDSDRYLVLGCDGIFEKATNQVLLDFLLPRLRQRQTQTRRPRQKPVPLSSVCSTFLDENIAKNPAKEQGLGCDNMTLMVVDLHAGLESAAGPAQADTNHGGRATAARTQTTDLGAKKPGSRGKRTGTQLTISKDGPRWARFPGRRRRLLLSRQARRKLAQQP